MKLSLELFGRVLTLSLAKPDSDTDEPERYTHDNTASQTEVAPQLYYDTDVTAFGFTRRTR